MSLRPLLLLLCASLAIVAAGCGDDDEDGEPRATTRAEAPRALGDVEPRANKPNFAGGDAPIAALAQRAGEDAIGYFEQVFRNGNVPYERPSIEVRSEPGEFCGAQFDPAATSVHNCRLENQPESFAVSAPRLEARRRRTGDAAVAFLVGHWMSWSAVGQLDPHAWDADAGPEYNAQAACFTGAWIRNAASRQLLEAGDDTEIRSVAMEVLGGEGAGEDGFGPADVQKGYDQGIDACTLGA